MTKCTRGLFLLSILFIYTSCATTANHYQANDNIKNGLMDEPVYQALRQILSGHSVTGLQDTILIKYDYNNETCWDRLDQKDDNYIRGFITRNNDRMLHVSTSRKNVSFFQFREPGNNLNKLKKWNSAIVVDSSRQLYKLLFKKRSVCGNSIAILPDRRFVFIRSDSHSEVLDLTHDKIVVYLGNK